MATKHSTYRTHFLIIIGSLLRALFLALKHFKSAIYRKKNLNIGDPSYFKQKDGVVTTRYPYESIPVPDNGRYRLHNEMEDCIVCDLCAKVCPVNCIAIDPIKSTVEIGKTSDGSTRRIYAATFDIDMAKCCYCGLCTTVCPTESLTMTKAYDYSEYDIRNMVYHFADLSPEESVVKRNDWDEAQLAKQAAKATVPVKEETATQTETVEIPTKPKAFIPKAMPQKVAIPVKKLEDEGIVTPERHAPETPKPEVAIPLQVIIPVKKIEPEHTTPTASITNETPKPRAVPPKIKIPLPKKKDDEAEKGEQPE